MNNNLCVCVLIRHTCPGYKDISRKTHTSTTSRLHHHHQNHRIFSLLPVHHLELPRIICDSLSHFQNFIFIEIFAKDFVAMFSITFESAT